MGRFVVFCRVYACSPDAHSESCRMLFCMNIESVLAGDPGGAGGLTHHDSCSSCSVNYSLYLEAYYKCIILFLFNARLSKYTVFEVLRTMKEVV